MLAGVLFQRLRRRSRLCHSAGAGHRRGPVRISTDPPVASKKRPAVSGGAADTDKVTDSILIVEDSASVRRLIEVCLRELSLNIVGAADGVAGLEAARETQPAAIVLDIGLPGMDGWEVLRRLRADDATRETKVLILTAHAQPEVAVQAQEGGADDFMTKPFRPTDLRDRVAKMIAS